MGAAAEEWPSDQGVFTKTERWWRGRPVYVNTEGQLLHHGGTWDIGSKLGKAGLKLHLNALAPIVGVICVTIICW